MFIDGSKKFIALYNYDARTVDDLSFSKGDVLYVITTSVILRVICCYYDFAISIVITARYL